MAFSPMEVAKSLRMVPSSAWAGLVAPMSLRKSAMALSFSRTMGKMGPEDMNWVSSPKKGRAAWDVVEALGLGLRDGEALDGDDLEACLLDRGEDGGGIARADGVWLDDAEGAL